MNKSSIKVNYLLNTAYQILVTIVPIIITPYIARVLGADGIGVYSYTYSIISYFLLIAVMGTSTFGQRSIAYCQEDRKQRSIKFFEVLVFRIVTVFVSCIAYVLYLYYAHIDNIDIAALQIIYLVAVIFDITWFFQGLEDFKRVILRNTVVKIFNVFLIFIFVKKASDVAIYTFILAGMTLVGNLSVWVYLPKYLQRVRISELRPFANFKEIFLLFIPTVAVQIYAVVDKTMIGELTVGSSENGYYDQTEKVVRMALAIITSLGTVMIPRIAHVFSEQNYDLIQKYLRKSYKFVWFLGIPLMLGLIGITPVFVPVFYGPGYDKINTLLPIYSCLIIAVSISNVTGCQFLIPTKRQNIYTLAVTCSAIINIFLNILLIPKMLSVGAVIASVCAEFLGAIIMIVYVQAKNQINVRTVLKDSTKNWIAGIIMLVLLLLLSNRLNPTVISLCGLILLGAAVYFGILFLIRDEFILEYTNIVISKLKSRIKSVEI